MLLHDEYAGVLLAFARLSLLTGRLGRAREISFSEIIFEAEPRHGLRRPARIAFRYCRGQSVRKHQQPEQNR
jgi:hypothetical protein